MTMWRRAGMALLVVLTMGWLVVGTIYVAVLVTDRLGGDIFTCGDRPAGSSEYGTASWQWWYPGTRCTYDDVRASPAVDEPSYLSGVVAMTLLAWPVLLAVGVRRMRNDPDA